MTTPAIDLPPVEDCITPTPRQAEPANGQPGVEEAAESARFLKGPGVTVGAHSLTHLRRLIAGFEYLQSLCAEQKAKLEEAVWRPIETAPRTRAAILVYCPERMNTYAVSWIDNGYDEPGWFHFGGGRTGLDEEATHWRPLPARPLPTPPAVSGNEKETTDA